MVMMETILVRSGRRSMRTALPAPRHPGWLYEGSDVRSMNDRHRAGNKTQAPTCISSNSPALGRTGARRDETAGGAAIVEGRLPLVGDR